MKGNYLVDPLENLTIVILSRGRETVLTRSLDYWNSNRIKTIVVHNSDNPICPKSRVQGSVYLNSLTSYGERAGIAAKLLNTEFAILCNDDEVYLPSALRNMISNLIGSDDLVSVGGQCLAVSEYGPLICGQLIYRDMNNYKNLYNDPFARLEYHLDISVNHIGAMFRMMRSIHLQNLLIIFKMCDNISTPYIHEATSEILLSIYGKSLYINEIYWIRNWIEPAVQHGKWDRKLYFHIWWESEKYLDQKIAWIRILNEIIDPLINFKELEQILETNYKIRKLKELNELNNKKSYSRFLPSNLKYGVKRLLRMSKIPQSLDSCLLEAQFSKIKLDEIALSHAVKALL